MPCTHDTAGHPAVKQHAGRGGAAGRFVGFLSRADDPHFFDDLLAPRNLERMLRFCVLVIFASAMAAHSPAGAKSLKCPSRAVQKVYAIGSSTMGMSLGGILRDAMKPHGVTLRTWGKASSGLARPDFHDWVAKAPGLMKRHRPQAVVVSLGTNDGQNLKHGKHWYSFGSSHYKRIYRERIDAMLQRLGGPRGARPVVWLGPTALPDRRGAARMKLLSKLIEDRIERYVAKGGAAVFVDGITRTVRRGKLIRRIRVPGRKRQVAARAPDNIHLTRAGVRWMLAQPILDQLRPCFSRRTAEASTQSRRKSNSRKD